MASLKETILANYNRWRRSKGLPEKPADGLVIAPAPDVVLPEAPEAKVSEPVNIEAINCQNATLRAENVSLKAELTCRTQERDDLKAALDSKTTLYENLKRSMGLMAAQNVANVPAVGESKSLIDIYNAMPECEAKTAFYQAHQAELSKFVNKPTKA